MPRVLGDMGIGLVIGTYNQAIYVNRALCSLTGYSAVDLLAMRLGDLVPSDARESALSRAQRRLAGEEEPAHYETELLHRDGHRIPVEVHAERLVITGQAQILAILRDLTDVKRVEAELASRTRQQAAVAELLAQALAEPDVPALMEAAVGLAARTLEVEYAAVYELLSGVDALLLRAGVGWKEGCVGRTTVGTGLDSQAGYTLSSDAPVVVEDLAREDRFRIPPVLTDHGVKSGVSVAVVPAGRPWGVLATHATEQRLFSADDVHFLKAVANVLAESVEHAEMDEALRAAHDQERRLRQRLEAYSRLAADAQEAERSHIARELHDEVGQLLTGLNLTLENLERLPPEALGVRLGRARALVAELLERVQGLSLDLRPAVLDDLGLLPALLRLVERFTAQTGVAVTLDHSGLDGRLRPEIETAAYRIAQEGLTNVARHAGTGRAVLSCVRGEGSLVVEVADEGVGFDVEAARAAVTSGLIGMEERARSAGGRLRVESRPGAGTSVVAELPLADMPGPER